MARLAAYTVNIVHEDECVWLGTSSKDSLTQWSLSDVLEWRRQPLAEKERIIAHNTALQQAVEALWMECCVKDGEVLTTCTASPSKLGKGIRAHLEYNERAALLTDHLFIPLSKGRTRTLDPRLLEIKRMYDDGPDGDATVPRGDALAFLMQTGCHAAGCTEIAGKACAGCQVATYCSQACQKAHWTSHKAGCKIATHAAAAAAAALTAGSGGGGGGGGGSGSA